MKILVFTEGTIIMHSSAKGLTREEMVNQSKSGNKSICDYKNYIPIGNSPGKLKTWSGQGAEIFYLTSREAPEEIADIKNVLEKYEFPDRKNLLFRQNGKTYKDAAEKLTPDILIEDDCESIGGKNEMTYTNIRSDLKTKIKSVVIREFAGIDNLPDHIFKLVIPSS